MAVKRTVVFLIGTSETSGVSIASGLTSVSSETDILGNQTSEAWANVYYGYTFPNSTPTGGGTIQLLLYPSSTPGHAASDAATPIAQDTPVQNTTREPFGGPQQLGRYMTAVLFNNATGQTISNAWCALEVFQES